MQVWLRRNKKWISWPSHMISDIDAIINETNVELLGEENVKKVFRVIPTIESILPRLAKYFAKFGISISYSDKCMKMWYTQKPCLDISFLITDITQIGRINYKRHDRYTINGYTLIKQLCREYGTFYHDEAFGIKIIKKTLPQPIAEAIIDCMQGVIARRTKILSRYFEGDLYKFEIDYTSTHAWRQEILYTLIDTYNVDVQKAHEGKNGHVVSIYNNKKHTNINISYHPGDSWEEGAKRIYDIITK